MQVVLEAEMDIMSTADDITTQRRRLVNTSPVSIVYQTYGHMDFVSALYMFMYMRAVSRGGCCKRIQLGRTSCATAAVLGLLHTAVQHMMFPVAQAREPEP
jgi:hypothetical protein